MRNNKITEVSPTYLEREEYQIDRDRPLPFEDFYFSFLLDARQRLNGVLADR
jgi:hypothetical protein